MDVDRRNGKVVVVRLPDGQRIDCCVPGGAVGKVGVLCKIYFLKSCICDRVRENQPYVGEINFEIQVVTSSIY